MPQKFFISDLHLSEDRPQTLNLFLHFTQTRPKSGDSIFILGDLFDTWIGDDDDSSIASNIRSDFKRLTKEGIHLFIQRGNRDFLLGKQFMKDTGAKILSDPTVMEVAGERAILMHGDLLCTDDTNYLKARKKLRNPLFQWIVLRRSLESRRSLAKEYRLKSKLAIAKKSPDIMDAKNDAVNQYLMKFNADLLIHGHTHRPAVHEHILKNGKKARRVVLDEWHKTYASIWIDDEKKFFQEKISID
mgnify:FL=1|tara:strand:- start:694 stop:1428 length:735 start_codon:yes stop_codon:yes gene_type:complete